MAQIGMSRDEKEKIQSNYATLMNVDAERIMDKFVDEGFFSISDIVEGIMKQRSTQGRMEQLISLITKRSSSDSTWTPFEFFIHQLKMNDYGKLARQIEQTDKKPIQVSEAGNDQCTDLGIDVPHKAKMKRISDGDALCLAMAIPTQAMEQFGNVLGLNDVEVSHIKADYERYGTRTVIQQIIITWKNLKGPKGTLENILEKMQIAMDRNIGLNAKELRNAVKKIVVGN